MSIPAFILFDDGHDLSPLTDLRASFELRTGSVTTLQRMARQLPAPIAALVVPQRLAALVAQRRTLPVNQWPDVSSFLLINGRCTSLHDGLADLPLGAARLNERGGVLAAHLTREDAEAFTTTGKLPADCHPQPIHFPMIERPWQLLEHVRANLPADLYACALPRQHVAPATVQITGGRDVYVAASATVSPMVVLDTSAGDIAIDEHAVIEPFVLLTGPCYVGAHSIVAAHTHIRPYTVIGEQCKVGGEINASIFHSHSNKAHYGYLGNSIVGQWVNLGAGTTTSNLKNTYGVVNMQTNADLPAQATAMTNLGSIIGDHVKTAIGTRLATGTCLATGAMFAAGSFAPKFINRFAFVTDRGVARYDFDKFCQVASRMMQRRNETLSPAEIQRLAQLHATVPV